MIKTVSPWAVAIVACLCLLIGFLAWKDAPDAVKLAGALIAILGTSLAHAVLGGSDSDKAGPALVLLGCLSLGGLLASAQSCTANAREVAIVDATKLAFCAADKCGDVPNVEAFGLCLAAKCAAQSIPPEDLIHLFEGTKRIAARAGACGPRDAGTDGGSK